MPDVKLVSFTVDPKNDTPADAGRATPRDYHAEPGRWFFLTGEQAALETICRKGFKLGDVDGSLVHSTRFVLLDRHSRVRGFYNPSRGRCRDVEPAARYPQGRRREILMTVHDLPSVNATLNALAAILLVWGYTLIRRKRIQTHRKVMLAAFVTSSLFLICYIVYHAQVGSVHFPKTGAIRTVYFSILGTHTLLAATVPVLAIITLSRGLGGRIRQASQDRPLDTSYLAVCQRNWRGGLPDALSYVTYRVRSRS